MTSGEFHSIFIESIKVDRAGRQRKELLKIDELAETINRLGLIHPLVITRDHTLVAGERRLTACKKLGWTHIPCQYTDEVDPIVLKKIELEENVKRLDLPWADNVKATEELHRLNIATNPKWTQEKTAESIGLDQSTIAKHLTIAKAAEKDPSIYKLDKLSKAYTSISNKNARESASQLDLFVEVFDDDKPKLTESILNADFNEWARTYSGPRFNFIHCDFPYGVDAHKFHQSSAPIHGDYDDSEDVYWTLLTSLANNLDKLASESCHIIFWFSMRHYVATMEFFSKNTDFIMDPFPLIWYKSDGSGIIPDPSRGPRRIYETALFGRRGDRKIVTSVANAYAAPLPGKSIHMSEKSEPMLRHFFRMVVDETTVMLDPTAGSGSALRAAESLNAKFVLGLERDKEFAEAARVKLMQSRGMKEVTK